MIFGRKKKKQLDDRFEITNVEEIEPNRYRITTVSERFGEVTQTVSTIPEEVLDEIHRINHPRLVTPGLLISGKGSFTPPMSE